MNFELSNEVQLPKEENKTGDSCGECDELATVTDTCL